jgi:hypothetical protein
MPDYSQDRNFKLRILVDNSLTPGQQIAQSIHAAIEYQHQHFTSAVDWYNNSNSVVILACSQKDLKEIITKCIDKRIAFSYFKEPDLDNMLTAVCLEPTSESRKITASFPLAGK